MDISGMGMMGGMDMDSNAMFRPTNEEISHIFWGLITTFLGVGVVNQTIGFFHTRLRSRQARDGSTNPTVPQNWASQFYATVITIFREIAYPQGFYITKKRLRFLTTPSLGRSLIILFYWITITVMLMSNSVIDDPYYFERIGFRAAWISVMQIPLITILAGKVNIVSIFMGISYERLNWLHRWVSRTLLVTVAVHGGFFLQEWIRADFLELELNSLPMVKYGLSAGGLLIWMNLSGLIPLRHSFYEFFVIQHLVSIAGFFYCAYTHVPEYAQYYVWMGIGFILFDRGTRTIWALFRNIRFQTHGVRLSWSDRIGYRTDLYALPGDVTRVVIKNVPFTWHPGQHLYLCIPRIGFIESHPFTISNTAKAIDGFDSYHAQLEVRAHSGFTRRVHKYAVNKAAQNDPCEVRAFIQGPFGTLPRWNTFDTVVLIAASTGASFTLPIMEAILDDPCCVRRIDFLLLVRQQPQCSCYLERLRNTASQSTGPNMIVRIYVAVTQKDLNSEVYKGEIKSSCCCGTGTPSESCVCGCKAAKLLERPNSTSNFASLEIQPRCQTNGNTISTVVEKTRDSKNVIVWTEQVSTTDVTFLANRPRLENFIRSAVESARGETAIVVCGGKPLTSHIRNCVVALSDERGVHKGSGAQGIFLHAEEYAF